MRTFHREKPLIGLTGGPGSGKSTLAAGFEGSGAYIIDADRIGHAILHLDQIQDAIKDDFGSAVFDSQKRINRKQLGSIVFKDPGKMILLNSIVHPMLIRRIHKQIIKFQADDTATLAVLDMALLFELAFHSFCCPVIYIKAPIEKRIARLMQTRGWSRSEIDQRIASQMQEEVRERNADIIINNEGSIQDLYEKADVIKKNIGINACNSLDFE